MSPSEPARRRCSFRVEGLRTLPVSFREVSVCQKSSQAVLTGTERRVWCLTPVGAVAESVMRRRGFPTVPAEEHILAWIAGAFRTVWAIEVLSYLARLPDSPHVADELVVELRVSSSVVSQSLAQLASVSLITTDDAGLIRLDPATPELRALAHEAVALYARRPNKVRRTIISYTSPSIAAFSDAFRLRKD